MSIDIHGDRDGGMPESFADDFRIGASAEHQTGMRVAEVVEPDIRKPCITCDLSKCVAHSAGV